MELYLVEEHVADGEDGFDAGKERLVLLFADGAEFTQRTRVDVVDAAQRHDELTFRFQQLFRQPEATVHIYMRNRNRINLIIHKYYSFIQFINLLLISLG